MFLQSEETTYNFTRVTNVITVLLLVELEFVLEQVMLLLVNLNVHQPVREDLKRSQQHIMEGLLELVSSVVTHYAPQIGFRVDDGFDFHDVLENFYSLITCIVQSLHP